MSVEQARRVLRLGTAWRDGVRRSQKRGNDLYRSIWKKKLVEINQAGLFVPTALNEFDLPNMFKQ